MYYYSCSYNKNTFVAIISKLCITQGIAIIKEITRGNKIVQQNDISWSKRILGNDALTHINTKIITHDFNPKVRPHSIPSIKG